MDHLSEESPGEAELSFRFLSGRVSLDLTATVGERWRRSFERLCTPADLVRWIEAAGLSPQAATARDDDLRAARALRDAIFEAVGAVRSGAPVPERAAGMLTAHAARPPLAPMLRGDRLVWGADDLVPAALSTVARDALDLLTGPMRDRIRECESPQCALLFVDASRPGRRRWCSSATCGGRERASNYRRRRAGATTEQVPDRRVQ